jgi:hypothetical protein
LNRRFTIAGLGLLLVVLALAGAAMVLGKSGRTIAETQSHPHGLRFRVVEFCDEPFPWNVIYGDLGYFHYECIIEGKRGVVTSFSYFRGDSEGKCNDVVVHWISAGEATAIFDKAINVSCRFELGRTASWQEN